jgi:hypothetical protein
MNRRADLRLRAWKGNHANEPDDGSVIVVGLSCLTCRTSRALTEGGQVLKGIARQPKDLRCVGRRFDQSNYGRQGDPCQRRARCLAA